MNQTGLLITTLMVAATCRVASVQAQPIAQYTFNDGTARDVSNHGHDGVLLNAAAIVDEPERGKVLHVNEGGMQVDGPFDITTSFTLSAWVKLEVPRTGRYYFGGPWTFRTDNEGTPEHYWIEVRYPGENFLNKADTRVLGNAQGQLDGQWHHLVLVLPMDGAFNVYFDGVEAPFRNANPVRAHDFGGAVGPIFFGSQNATGSNAIQGYMDDIRIYNYAVGPEDIAGLQTESQPELASRPEPADGATDVARDVTLRWAAGEFAASHDVYFGTMFEDVNDASRANPLNALVSQGHAADSYDAGRLTFGGTYYWRIDEVNALPSAAIFKGHIWSFTTEPLAYPIDDVTATASHAETGSGPQNTVNGSGLNDQGQHSINAADMWLASPAIGEPVWILYEFDSVCKLHEMHVWNYNVAFEAVLGFGLKDVTIEYSADGADWTVLGDWELARANATSGYTANTTIDLQGVAARFIRLTVNSGWGVIGQYGLSEVRFLSIPVRAGEPHPVDGATDVQLDAVLRWRAGREAASHEIYLSDRQSAVADGTALVGTVDRNRYDLGGLDLRLGTTYYWKVNEVNEAETPGSWEGDLWSFSTPAFFVIEDFESYTDDVDAEKTLWQTWIDGFEDDSNGSQVGYLDAPFAERAIVHSGRQSMPLFYDNAGGVTYSQAQITFDVPQDWTRAGIAALTIHFQGSEENIAGQLYVRINGVKVSYDGDPGTLTSASWTAWNIDLASLNANLSSIRTLAIGLESGGSGVLYIDDLRLLPDASF